MGFSYLDDPTDSDSDGLTDEYEILISKTDPLNLDSDGDGLNDADEWGLLGLDLWNNDTDGDGLSDYLEISVYFTDAHIADSDGDQLSDWFEVSHSWDISNMTTSVSDIWIGGEYYNDRTDPLNWDTDEDGLDDGQEGQFGAWWGNLTYYEGTVLSGLTPDPGLIFNFGFTHPLDNDTDDDSYWQLWDGSIASVEIPLITDNLDGTEIRGRSMIFIDPETGIPQLPKFVYTNPTNPDSDGDTGINGPEDRVNPPFGFFLNSDGYELSRDPPTKPLDGDSDFDGLLEEFEIFFGTNSSNPDSDYDGLSDYHEILIGSDPLNNDTDFDGMIDGEEFNVGTSILKPDTDGDGIDDYTELLIYFSDPWGVDSDGDGLDDFDELIYGTDLTAFDTDRDGLSDRLEIRGFMTDPLEFDSDKDGMGDGDEVENHTDPKIFNDFPPQSSETISSLTTSISSSTSYIQSNETDTTDSPILPIYGFTFEIVLFTTVIYYLRFRRRLSSK